MIRPVRVLLVEDNELDARMLLRAAKTTKLANAITVLSDGRAALNQMREAGSEQPDLVLLDLSLPGMSGFELLEEMKDDVNLRHIPVVILTSSAAEADVRTAYEHHAAGFVTKPLGIDGLLEIVTSVEHFFFEIVTLSGS